MAVSLNAASHGLGALVIPPFLELMIIYYGWRGAFMILSAIMANICVCGLMLRPLPAESDVPQGTVVGPGGNTQTGEAITDEHVSNPDNRDLPYPRHTLIKRTCYTFLKNVFKNFNISLFFSVRFLLQVIVSGFLFACIITFIITIVPNAVNIGISPLNASFLMIPFGLGVVIARIAPISYLVDKKFISASTLGGVSYLECGAFILIMPFIKSYVTLMSLTVLCGLTHGIGGGSRLVVVASCAPTKEEAPGALAWFLTFAGIGSVVFMSITGESIKGPTYRKSFFYMVMASKFGVKLENYMGLFYYVYGRFKVEAFKCGGL